MTRAYRVIDQRDSVTEPEVKSVQALSPEQAVLDALGVDAVRSGAKKHLVAKVYWQVGPGEPTNMVRMYQRLDLERPARDREKQLSRS